MSAAPSPEWLDELAEQLAAIVLGEPGGERFVLGQSIAGDGGRLEYTIALGAGEPTAVVAGGLESASVVFYEEARTAAELVAGRPAGELLGAGAVKVAGDVASLLRAQGLLSELAEALAAA